ncbi:hypothetical protein JQ631_23975 [Bradyrhizobium manausense]|uniref:hypothetical protein n=1 Tax=Bradyrhizobium manausense TaxID=989370 RepID=UPI001BACE4C2|nr:hypothetical protein [Bradyrhizobium manausense]MBR0792154.1 hypothetical protein [Bradyrhizobium manausense]
MDGAFWILIGISLLIYLAPSIVAAERRHHQLKAIVALNISAGAVVLVYLLVMTYFLPKNDATERLAALIAMYIFAGAVNVGWVVALVWSLTQTYGQQAARDGNAVPPPVAEQSRWLTLMKEKRPRIISDKR